MKTERLAAYAPRTRAVAETIAELQGPCLGCKGCQGLCIALVEAMTLPDAILSRGGAR
ncbi:hypothetical protein [Aestuariivita boseongensis]|uniref:hypothetical protein n=1 Tax=Aestuariivita boseongensis TaxID=1470562 RepID=UPI00155DCC45|nr:hypothetical protein [Aestuariivita boseongensis]